MPRARRKRDRLHQVAAWLRVEHSAKYPVDLRVERLTPPGKSKEYGDCNRIGRRFLIRIDPRADWSTSLDTLFHEWAHALTWWVEGSHHSDEWGLAYARIYRDFYDLGGHARASDY